MKRHLSITLIFAGLAGVPGVTWAQTALPAPITVKLLFEPVQSIVLNPARGTIRTFFNADGWTGTVTVQQEQLTVFSTSTFEIDIEAAEHFFFQTEGKQRLAVSPLNVDALPQRRSTQDDVNTTGAVTFDVRYRPAGSERIIGPALKSSDTKKAESKGPTTELLYTVHAK